MNGVDLGPRYELRREIGSGGVGHVLLVYDRHLKRELALKLLHEGGGDPDELEAFQREFALLAEIAHPCIAKAFDFGYLGTRPYFTSEFIPGRSLDAWRISSEGDCMAIVSRAIDVAEALAFLHRSGILHLDVKPSNVVVSAASRSQRAVLIDFGLFRRGLKSVPRHQVKGSLPYMAPEYFRGEALSPATDVYALGVMLYWLLTRRFPRRALPEQEQGAFVEEAWEAPPPPPSRMCAAVSLDLENVILKCLAVEPCSRYSTAEDLLRALELSAKRRTSMVQKPLAPLVTVGRSEELARIDGFVKRLRGGKRLATTQDPVVLAITGPRGMGQSHLMREVKVRAQTMGVHHYLETGYPGQHDPPGSLLRCLAVHAARTGRKVSQRWRTFLSRLKQPRRFHRNETTESERRLRRAEELILVVRAVREPVIIAVDGLQFWDEISVSLVVDLARSLGEIEPADRPPIRLVLGYREEGASTALLEELTGYLLKEGKGEVVTLKPLDVVESLELHRSLAEKDAREIERFKLFQETAGSPGKIVALVRGGDSMDRSAGRTRESSSAMPANRTPEPSKKERQLLVFLDLLRRPSAKAELARLTGLSRQCLTSLTRKLESRGLLTEADGESSKRRWLPGPAMRGSVDLPAAEMRSRFHLAIARELRRMARGQDDPRLVESVHHFALAGSKRQVVKHGLLAARYLQSTFQNRASLDLHRIVLDAIPRSQKQLRVEVALAIAELQAQLGDVEDGIRILKDTLRFSPRLVAPLRAKVLLWVATLHSRQGDYRRASSFFQEGFRIAERFKAGIGVLETLFFLNEFASLKGFIGEYKEANDLCERGFRVARKSHQPKVRELVLYLSATRATLAQRAFRYDAAIKDLEAALEIAETIGSPANQAIVLNNLGLVYNNCDLYAEAIRSFREAEKTSLCLDEGPSFLATYSNLAVLYAKTGEFSAMETALSNAERLGRGAPGRRAALFLEHARGLARLYQGRYADSRQHLETSSRLAREAGDELMAAFDAVHCTEALIFTGAYSHALAEGRRLAGAGLTPRIARMVQARLAFLHALTGEGGEAASAVKEYARIIEDRPVGFLEAWDHLFLGWGLSITKSFASPGAPRDHSEERAPGHLDSARDFFERHGLHPAASLVRWIRAEELFLEGNVEEGILLLDSEPAPAGSLAALLTPLLRARLFMARAGRSSLRGQCADLLAEAGSRLVGNVLPEWDLRLRALRTSLGSGASQLERELEQKRRELARGLPEETRRKYLLSGYWRAWTCGLALPASGAAREVSPPRTESPRTRTATAPLCPARATLVAESQAMRQLLALLDRIRASDLPVLIAGETGTGKEKVARIIHEESRHSSGPFVVVDCATIPEQLLETELFGARKGAFSGLENERTGLLATAGRGTVLVDEITLASLEVQGKLLRVLSGGGFRPLGAEAELESQARFLFATSKDLDVEVKEGRFRQELLHRVRVLTIRVPPLRERIEDLPGLVDQFLGEGEGPPPALEAGLIARLAERGWPGNVRELRNVIARMRLEHPRTIGPAAVDSAEEGSKTRTIFPANLLATKPLATLRESLERDYVMYHLRRLQCDTGALSVFLGLNRQKLYRLCRRLEIHLWKERKRFAPRKR